MRARIQRSIKQPFADRLLGSLLINGLWQCFTREPPLREDGLFVPGDSALPAGFYNVSLAKSARHGRMLPLLASTRHDGEDRRCVRIGMFIYPGNSHATTIDREGEIVLGQEQLGKSIARTRLAFEPVLAMFMAAVNEQEAIDMEIV